MESHEYEILSEAFMGIVVAIHRNFFRQMRLPLPINQFSVLKVLDNEGPLTGRDVGEMLAISKQQLSPILDKLEKMPVSSAVPCPLTDASSKFLSPTKGGRSSRPLMKYCASVLSAICAPFPRHRSLLSQHPPPPCGNFLIIWQ